MSTGLVMNSFVPGRNESDGSMEKRELVTWSMAVRMTIGTSRNSRYFDVSRRLRMTLGRLEPGRVRLHHDVEDDQVGPLLQKRLQPVGPAVRDRDVVAVPREDLGQAGDEVPVVVDDEDLLGSCCSRPRR